MERPFLAKKIRNDFVAKNSDGRTVKANVLGSSHAFIYTGKGKDHPITGHEGGEEV
jgi:hypothetical protein